MWASLIRVAGLPTGMLTAPSYCSDAVIYDGTAVSVDKGRTTDDVCQDFSEAFDSVPHNILLSRVERYGFGGWMDEEPKEWWSMAQCPLPEVKWPTWCCFLLEGPTALQFGVQGSMREDAVCKCWALLEQGWKKREGRVGTGTSTKHLRAIGGSAGGGKSLKAWQMCHHIAR